VLVQRLMALQQPQTVAAVAEYALSELRLAQRLRVAGCTHASAAWMAQALPHAEQMLHSAAWHPRMALRLPAAVSLVCSACELLEHGRPSYLQPTLHARCLRAMADAAIDAEVVGADRSLLARLLTALGRLQRLSGAPEDAEAGLQMALSCLDGCIGPGSGLTPLLSSPAPKLAAGAPPPGRTTDERRLRCLLELGLTLVAVGQPKAALETLTQAREAARSRLAAVTPPPPPASDGSGGGRDSSYGNGQSNSSGGGCGGNMGDRASDELYARAWAYGLALRAVAAAQSRLRRHQTAHDTLVELHDLQTEVWGPRHGPQAETAGLMAAALREMGAELALQAALLRHSLKSLKAAAGPPSPIVARITWQLAGLVAESGSVDEVRAPPPRRPPPPPTAAAAAPLARAPHRPQSQIVSPPPAHHATSIL